MQGEGTGKAAFRHGRVAAALLACFAAGALASIGMATHTPSPYGYGYGYGYGYQYSHPPTTTPAPKPTTLVLSPATDVNPVGTNHTVTATVRDQDGDAMAGVLVRFSVTGSVTTTGQCTTGADGTCTFTYAGPMFPGADLIRAYADSDGDNTRDPGEPEGTASKAWIVPASTPGHVTGGGFILVGGAKVTFGFNAKNTASDMRGECTVVDHSTKRMVKCREVTAVVVSGNTAEIHGTGTDNGAPMTYVIRVTDMSEPGKGADSFSISTSTGYAANGILGGGNIQIHAGGS